MSFNKLMVILLLIVLPFDASEYFQYAIGPFRVEAVKVVILVGLFFVVLKQLATRAPIAMGANLAFVFLMAIVCLLPGLTWKTDWVKDLKIALNFLEYLALFYIFSQVIRDEAFLKRVLQMFLLVATCLAVLTVLKALGYDLPGLERKTAFPFLFFQMGVVGLEGNFVPALSLFLVGGLPLLWQRTLIKLRWLSIPLTLLFLTAAMVTAARGLYLSIVVQVMGWLYLGYFYNPPPKRKLIVLVGGIIGTVILASFAIPIFNALKSIRPQTFDNRYDSYFLGASLAFSDLPSILFGFGKGDFMTVNNRQMVHNFIEDILLSGGIMTLFFVLAMLFIIFWRLKEVPTGPQSPHRTLKVPLMVGFLGILTVSIFDPITTSAVFWTYLAVIYTFTLIPSERATNIYSWRAYQVSRV
jgi:O-antigen ligase